MFFSAMTKPSTKHALHRIDAWERRNALRLLQGCLQACLPFSFPSRMFAPRRPAAALHVFVYASPSPLLRRTFWPVALLWFIDVGHSSPPVFSFIRLTATYSEYQL
jgi:hypothetical protein